MFEPPADPPVTDPGAQPPAKNDWKSRAGGTAVGIGVIAAKFKTVLLFLGPAKGILISGLSVIVSVWFYTTLFGLKFAIAFVMLIAVHELGHVYFIRSAGLPGGMPYFLPGLGAFTTLGARPASAYQSAWIAFGGPLFGTLGAALCLSYGMIAGENFWYAVAFTGFFMNFLNLMPVPPFDGGRIVEAISPRIWIAGLVVFLLTVVVLHRFTNPLILLIVLFSLPQVVKAWKGDLDPTYHALTARQRATVAVAYFALAAALFGLSLLSYVPAPGQPTLV